MYDSETVRLPRCITFFATALVSLLPTVPGAAQPATDLATAPVADCSSPLPQVLDVALPYAPGAEVDAAERSLRPIAQRWYDRAALCPGRPLQVNVAFGSDYQILDWLDRGRVEVGVVSTLALHLLQRDGIDLVPVPTPSPSPADSETRPPWLEESAALFRSSDITGAATGVARERRYGEASRRDFEQLLEESWRAALSEDGEPGAHRVPESGLRLVLPSHLSTVGFLVPIGEAERWLRPRLDDHLAAKSRRPAEREGERLDDRFWEALFARSCFHFGDTRGAEGAVCPLPNGRRVPVPATEVEVVAVPPGSHAEATVPAATAYDSQPVAYRDHLVIRRSALESIFRPPSLEEAVAARLPRLPAHLGRLFGRAAGLAGGDATPAAKVPPSFRSHLQPEPYYDTRTFAFGIAETTHLLRLHQRTSGRPQLALVLPGGGVKAAYQSKLLDHLYGTGQLVNYRLRSGESAADGRLGVVYVIGTSGGALIGYFVARLGPQGPYDLSEILWDKDPELGPAHRDLVDSSDIFPFSDLPRYASLVTIVLVLFGCLALASMRHNGWLSPDRQDAGAADGEPPAESPLPRSPRYALLVPLALVVATTPMLVRWVNGEASLEQVPEFEGFFFAVLLVLAMFADQCVVHAGSGHRTPGQPETWVSPTFLVVVGLTLLALPALGRWFAGLELMLAEPVSAGVAYYVLGLLIAGFALGIVERAVGDARREPLWWLLGLVIGTAASYLFLRLLGARVLGVLDDLPLFIAGLFAVPVVVLIQRLGRAWRAKRARRGSGEETWIDRALRSRAAGSGQRWAERRAAQRVISLLPVAFACLLILDFTRPPAEVFVSTPLAELPFATSKLDTLLGGFAVCIGALLVVVGLLFDLLRQSNRFHLTSVRRFVNAAILLVLGFAAAVYTLLWIASRFAWFELTLFELTGSFWKGLIGVSLTLAVLLFAVSYFARRRSAAARWLTDALRFLSSRHPNAYLVSRRFLRLGLVAIGGLVWWNVVLAPGFYGNRNARSYLLAAAQRFDNAHAAAHGSGEPNRLTARLLTPANALEVDGTRYILAVPGEEPCPSVRQAPGSGSVWHRFRLLGGDDADAANVDPADPCRTVRLRRSDGGGDLNLLEAAVFASGSPFPIFPAHRIGFERGAPKEALVDGGYTNLVPIDAATDVGAEQVLIVNSSHPLPPAEGGERVDLLTGPLVDNFLRLPGFLYERAQQIDRRSRAGLFVVSLSPAPQEDWPLLTDFRSAVVERMWAQAESDLDERIGMVESWGPPRFQLSLRVEGRPAPPADPAGR